MDLYAENILDHYKHPRGMGSLSSPTVTCREENASCGDDLTIDLTLMNGKIAHLQWRGDGCAISQAAMSMLSEELQGMDTAAAAKLTPGHVYELLGVPVGPRRFKCALLCLHTLKNALRLAHGDPVQSWLETVEIEN